MARLSTLLLVLMVAVGCGKKKPPAAPAPSPVTPAVPGVPAPPTPPPNEVARQLRLIQLNRADEQAKAAAALANLAATDPTVLRDLVNLLDDKTGLPVGRGTIAGPNSVREAVILALLLSGPKGEQAAVAQGLPVLTAALADPKPDVRCNAASAIARLGPKAAPATQKLWPLASDPAAPIREAALRALIDIGGVSPAPLCKLLVHTDAGVRVTAAENLRDFSGIPPEAVGDLAMAVTDDNPGVRLAAADALATLGPKAAPAVPALLKALADRVPKDKLDLDEFAFAVLNAVAAVGEPAVPAVTKSLTDPNPVARFLGAYMIGEIGPPAKSAAPALEKLLAEPTGLIVQEAARALVVVTGSTDKVKGLIEGALTSADPANRLAAVVCVGRMGPAGQPFAESALRLLADPRAEVRAAALDYVATLDPATAKPAVPTVAKLLSDEDADTRLQAAKVLRTLGRAAAPAAAALAKAVASDADDGVRTAALDALASFGAAGKAALPELLKVIGDPTAPAAVRVRALAVAPSLAPADADLAKAVTRAMSDESQEIRGAACQVLPGLADPPADAVTKLGDLIVSEKDYAGRTLAVRAAADLGPKAAPIQDRIAKAATSDVREYAAWGKLAVARVGGNPDGVQAVIRTGLASQWPAERHAALAALGGVVLPSAENLPGILAASRDRAAATRQLAAAALMRVPDSAAAVTRLTEMLKDADSDVKQAAIASLEALGPMAKAASRALKELANGKDDTARAARKALRAVEEKGE